MKGQIIIAVWNLVTNLQKACIPFANARYNATAGYALSWHEAIWKVIKEQPAYVSGISPIDAQFTRSYFAESAQSESDLYYLISTYLFMQHVYLCSSQHTA